MSIARQRFLGEVEIWQAKLKVKPKRVQIQAMRYKWASCSTAGRVCFNRDLLGKPRAFRRAVIVHELLHLRVPNHGKLFKGLLEALAPGWEKELHKIG
jgi:hypothetical protein